MAKQATVNQSTAVNGGCDAVWTLIATMILAGWTKVADSDGTTYSSGGTQVTGPATGANGLNNSRAWVRMQDPDGRREWIFQRGTVGDYSWRCKFSESSRFTGGSPAATVVPSAADEAILSGAGSDASPTFATIFNSSAGSYRAHAICQDAAVGDVYEWFLLGTPNAGGDPTGGFACAALAVGSYPSADVSPCVHIGYQSSTPYGGGANYARKWYRYGLSGAAFVDVGQVVLYQNAGGGASGPMSGDATTTLPGVNPYDTTDEGVPAMWGRVGSTSSPGWAGFGATLKQKMVSRTYPDTIDLATDAYVYADSFLVPWPESVVPM